MKQLVLFSLALVAMIAILLQLWLTSTLEAKPRFSCLLLGSHAARKIKPGKCARDEGLTIPASRRPIGLHCQACPSTGWGQFCLQLNHWLRQTDEHFLPIPLSAAHSSCESMAFSPVKRSYNQARKLADAIQFFNKSTESKSRAPFPVLHAVPGSFAFPAGETEDTQAAGSFNVGLSFLETSTLSPKEVRNAKGFDLILAGSQWNVETLHAHGVHARLLLQGVDLDMFQPRNDSSIATNKFIIFSGGKLEHRKGQDLVIKAFVKFVARRPDAVLVTAWGSLGYSGGVTSSGIARTLGMILAVLPAFEPLLTALLPLVNHVSSSQEAHLG